MLRIRRFGVAVAAALVVVTGFQVIGEQPADARKVGNPGGGFTLRVQNGFMRIKTNSFDFDDEGRLPQCSDGSNNDGSGADAQDSAVDHPADPQCTSPTDDSETQPGFQAKLPIQMTGGTVAANGNLTFPLAGVSFPPQYLFVNADDASGGVVDDFIVTIQIQALTDFTGVLNANTGTMNLDMNVRVRATGGPLDSNCQVSPINIQPLITGVTSPPGPNTPISGIPYDPATGRSRIVNNSFSVPGASNCGTVALFYNLNNAINDQLGLPSAAGNNEGQFTVEFMPTRPTPGIVASFTATPSSGVAPLTVNFNAGASTGTGLSYAWDFDNNGSTDATGVTTLDHLRHLRRQDGAARVTDVDGDFVDTTRLVTVGANLAAHRQRPDGRPRPRTRPSRSP